MVQRRDRVPNRSARVIRGVGSEPLGAKRTADQRTARSGIPAPRTARLGLGRGGRHGGRNFGKDFADVGRNAGYGRSNGNCDKTNHQSVFKQILSASIFAKFNDPKFDDAAHLVRLQLYSAYLVDGIERVEILRSCLRFT